MNETRTCAVDGCETPLESTGKLGRPNSRCAEHVRSCIVRGCVSYAISPKCPKHRQHDMRERAGKTPQAIALATKLLEDAGYTVLKPGETREEENPYAIEQVLTAPPADFWKPTHP